MQGKKDVTHFDGYVISVDGTTKLCGLLVIILSH